MLVSADRLVAAFGSLRELSGIVTVVKNWSTRRIAKNRNMILGEK
jgi:hypothetical protein